MTTASFFDSIPTSATADEVKAVYVDGLAARNNDSIRQFMWAREAAIYGLSEAMQWVINAYKSGFGTEPSAQMAFEWLKKAAEDKREWAYFDLAIAYRGGAGTRSDIKEFRDWMEKAAAIEGGREAMRMLAESYQKSKYGEADPNKVSHWTRLMAAADGAVAMIDLSKAYATGAHVRHDVDLQLTWAERAVSAAQKELANKNKRDGASEDLPRALKALADAYDANGNPLKVAQTLKAAAEASSRVYTNANAANCTDKRNQSFDEDPGIPEDLLQIILQYQKSLKANTKVSFRWLKIITEIVEREYINSRKCLPEFGTAVRALAEAYKEGNGTVQNHEQYRSTLEIAKKALNPKAMYELAHVNAPTYEIQLRDAADAGSDDAFYRIQVLDCDLPARKAKSIQDTLTNLRAQVYQYRDDFHSISENEARNGIAHYTGSVALEGMLDPTTVESKNLMRMYNFAYFNDPKEGRRLYLDDYPNNPLKKFGPATAYKDDVLTDGHFVYIGSFSLVQDLLDLWRAYTDNGKGFSIVTPFSVFPKNSTQALMETWANKRKSNAMPTLYKVLYGDQEAKDVLQSLSPKLEAIENAIQKLVPEKRAKICRLVRTIANELLFLYKSKDYKSEEEVRFVKALGLNMSEVQRDNSRSPTRLYMETQPLFFSTPRSKIIIGPTVENQPSVAMALRHALTRRGWDGACEVSYSKVNYQIASSARR